MMLESRLWQASHQQIYRTLKSMAVDGFLVFKDDPQEGKPDRKVYSLTAEGVAKLNEAVDNATPSLKSLHSIRTIMLNVRNHKYFEELLEQLKTAIEKTEQLLEKTENTSERIAMQREIYINRAEESYCVDVLEYLQSHKDLAA